MKTYTLQGMDCADCARHIQDGVEKLKGVESARADFATGLLYVEGVPGFPALRSRVEALGYGIVDPEEERSAVSDQRSADSGQRKANFFQFLLARKETRLALLGGGLILLSLAVQALGLSSILRIVLQLGGLALAGYPVARSGLANLWINRSVSINLLMTLAALGAVAIGDLGEAATLIFLYDLAEALEGYTTDRARRTLGDLHALAPSSALRMTADGEETVPAALLQPGERILVLPGERIPIDGLVLAGASSADQAPITGESQAVEKGIGDPVYAGSLNGLGALEVRVTHRAADTTLARIVSMVTEAQSHRAPSQRTIDQFAAYYTPAVVVVAVLVALIPPLLFGQAFLDSAAGHGWLYRGLAVLVIACPCALVISAPVTILSGVTAAARRGVLFKGGAYLEALARVDSVAFDKTGTLTRGKPAVTVSRAVDCLGQADGDEDCSACQDVLALAGALERRSTHPLASAVVAAAGARGLLERYPPAEAVEVINGSGLRGTVDGRTATVGSHGLFDRLHPHSEAFCAEVQAAEDGGQTTMLVCDGDRVRGFIAASDEIRPESKAVIAELHRLGLHTLMLTGDNPSAAARVGRDLGIDDLRAGLLPEDKVRLLNAAEPRQEPSPGSRMAMVGDGINDAPALAQAALGIAVGGPGNATAMETADVVLMSGDLTRLPLAVRLARFTLLVMRQNVAFSLATKLIFILLALSGVATMWMAVAADMGVALLVTFNGLRPLRLKE